MRNFRSLDIWQASMDFTLKTYAAIEELPADERFGLKSQISRCAVSIPSNIAEGSSRRSNADFARFLEISLGSSYELETQLLIAHKLDMINATELIEEINLLQKRINKMISTVRNFK